MKQIDWKKSLDSLVLQNPDLNKENACPIELPEKKKAKQTLRVELDKRKGKLATLITEFEGGDDELKLIAKTLKTKLGIGGSMRDGEILVQGDVRKKVAELLIELDFKVKRINF